ncbi:hypothetical protein ACVWYH_007089 [Bradyrhizobium sp. GM24.11]
MRNLSRLRSLVISSGNLQRPRPYTPKASPAGAVFRPRLPIPHRCNLRLTPIEVGPDLGATTPALATDKERLDIRQSNIVGPAISVQRNVMAAPVRAIDQDAAQPHLAHFAEGDLDRPTVGVRRRVASDLTRHAAIETRRAPESNCQFLGSRNAVEAQRVGDVEESVRKEPADIPKFNLLRRAKQWFLGCS